MEFDDHGSIVKKKKQRIRYSISEMLSFSSTTTTTTITSSVGKENRIPISNNNEVESNIVSTPEINDLFIKKSSGSRIVEPVKTFSDNENGRIAESVSLVKDDIHECGAAIVSNVVVKTPEKNNITGRQQRSKLNPVSQGDGKGVISESKAALHVEMLKKRFCHLIVKAQQVELLSGSENNIDPVKMQKEEQILKKKLKQAQIATEVESKMQLQRKREAARMALLKIEKRVDINDNEKTMRDFTMLLGYPPHCASCVGNGLGWYGLSFTTTSRTYWRETQE